MEFLASNEREFVGSWTVPEEDPDVLADVICGAGLLGVLAVLLLLRHAWSYYFFPDTLFWRALPLLLVIPPGVFLGALFAPGGLLEEALPRWPRALRLGLGGFASYTAPVVLLSMAAALGSLR